RRAIIILGISMPPNTYVVRVSQDQMVCASTVGAVVARATQRNEYVAIRSCVAAGGNSRVRNCMCALGAAPQRHRDGDGVSNRGTPRCVTGRSSRPSGLA